MLGFRKFTSVRPGDQIQEIPHPQPEQDPVTQGAAWPDSPAAAAAAEFWSPVTYSHQTTGSCTSLLQGGGENRREKKKSKPWELDEAPLIPRKPSCPRPELQPRSLGTLSPQSQLVQMALGQLMGFKESHSEVPCKSHLPIFSSPYPKALLSSRMQG